MMDKFKIGDEVWILYNNKPQSFICHDVVMRASASGKQIHVIGGTHHMPVDLCFHTEMQVVISQINYWQDMRLNRINRCNHSWSMNIDKQEYVCNLCECETGKVENDVK